MSAPDNQSYLAAGINRLSPWGTRSTTPKPAQSSESDPAAGDPLSKQQRGGDHKINHRSRLSLRRYPRDCPPVAVQWFFAVDIPKRKPDFGHAQSKVEKASPVPKKYSAFSKNDSRAIEAALQKLEHTEDTVQTWHDDGDGDIGHTQARHRTGSDAASRNSAKVPVNEDYLFDVDIEKRELGPAYWLGPVYDVRRGTWFYQDGSVQKPCEENLAAQLEEGYLKITPWRFPPPQSLRPPSQPRPRPLSMPPGHELSKTFLAPASSPVTPKSSLGDLRGASNAQSLQVPSDGKSDKPSDPAQTAQSNTHRLFGPYSNSVVTYQDATTAWILTDDFMSRMSSSMYQRFAGGSHFAGMKITRGYVNPSKRVDDKADKPANTEVVQDGKLGISTSGSPQTEQAIEHDQSASEGPISPASETRRQVLERHMSSLVSSATQEDPEQQEEEVRKRDEKEIREDYRDQEGDEQSREIEHLLLVTHGIGQRLGLRMESVNFIHDVNTLRKTLKAVYGGSADLQALNSEVDSMPKNCRIQCLPINWRHKLDFPKQSLKHNRKEHDLGDAGFGEEEDYPNLDDITVEGVPAVRNLITDLALDILLYQSPAYKDHISRIVVEECNRTYKLFMQRNPTFHGKVSLIGHSLGSAIMFDFLCAQDGPELQRKSSTKSRKAEHPLKLNFDVEEFYALGSPIGLFQMLKGRTVAARPSMSTMATKLAEASTSSSDPFSGETTPSTSKLSDAMGTTNSELPVSAPKCRQVFNIFHPTDPISYRIEPLISPAMASLKPQPLPYTKRGIFGAPVGAGLTGIGTRVGQSVSGLWSSFSTGIASSLLNRSLGISAEDEGKLRNQSVGSSQSRVPLSFGAGSNPLAAAAPAQRAEAAGEEVKQKLAQDTVLAGEAGEHPPTLIDAELETLYAGYQSRRRSVQSDGSAKDADEAAEWAEAEERARKLKKEEAKVRALNANGRVDYSIQEGAFDISLIAAVASHLSYWGDEDVSHFMISQLLSRQRSVRKSSSTKDLRG